MFVFPWNSSVEILIPKDDSIRRWGPLEGGALINEISVWSETPQRSLALSMKGGHSEKELAMTQEERDHTSPLI